MVAAHQVLPLCGASLGKEAAGGLPEWQAQLIQDPSVLGDTRSREGAGPALCTNGLG